MDNLLCPACGTELTEEMLRQSLICPNCKTKFRNRKYADFLELLVYYDIVEDVDFMDLNVYGEEIMVMNEDDSEELDLTPDEFDSKNEIWNEFEDDTELNENLGDVVIEQESWNIFEDEVAIEDELVEEHLKNDPDDIEDHDKINIVEKKDNLEDEEIIE